MKVMEAGLRDGVVMIIRDEVEFAIAQVRPRRRQPQPPTQGTSLAHTLWRVLSFCLPAT